MSGNVLAAENTVRSIPQDHSQSDNLLEGFIAVTECCYSQGLLPGTETK